MTTTTTALTVDEAKAEVEQWERQLAEWRAQLTDVEAKTRDARLWEVGGLSRKAGELQGLIASGTSAYEAAQARLVEAERTEARAEVARLRQQAEELFGQADRRQVRTSELLAELAVWEEVPAWSDQPAGHLEGGLPTLPVPKTELLRSEARLLAKRADDLEAHVAGTTNWTLPMVETKTGRITEYKGR